MPLLTAPADRVTTTPPPAAAVADLGRTGHGSVTLAPHIAGRVATCRGIGATGGPVQRPRGVSSITLVSAST
jgi:hypothetical protein